MRNLTPLHIRILIGVGIKSLGYLIVASGIFLSLRDKSLSLKVIYIGVCFVIFGWFLIVRALKLAKSFKLGKSEKFERFFKISAHIDGKFLGIKEGDTVNVRGTVRERIGKSWKDACGSVLLVLNGIPVSRTTVVNGKFNFKIPNLRRGVYDICVRFVEGCEEKRIKLKVMSFEEWKRNLMIFFVAILILISLMCLPIFVLIR